MGGPGDVWKQAADNFDRHLAAVGDDQWDAPTPCGEWTVRELVDHAVHWQAVVGAELGAGTTPGDDWATVHVAVAEAVQDPANLEGVTEHEGFGGLPKHQALGIATGDILLHSWDLARAIGADETLPAEAVEAVHMGLSRVPPQVLRSPTMFGAEVEVADDASAQDKLLGFAGRQP